MYAVTGATGQLGRLVVDALLREGVPAPRIVAAVRDPGKAADLAARGVRVREADYDRPDTLGPALEGVERLLLISSSEIGRRVPQHRAVVEAARARGVALIAYTSVLRADRSPLGVADEHRRTEAELRASGLPAVLLRNGWYTENHLAGLRQALASGVIAGGAGEGRIASASRADYAAAAAAALTRDGQAGLTHELAGDDAWTMAELAAEVSRQSGRAVAYLDMAQAEYEAALLAAGLPAPIAQLIADSDAAATRGALFDDGRALSRLTGRPTTPMPAAVAAALRG